MGLSSLTNLPLFTSNHFHFVADVVDGRELLDSDADRNILKVPFEERINVTRMELEHLLKDYTKFAMNTITSFFPEAFPDLKEVEIKHQYSSSFEREVKIHTGPLVFETESTLDGISKVITELIDVACPVVLDKAGKPAPAFPTTFSGDQQTEKCARRAQLALCDNGNMKDRLQFFEGRHELLHYMFMLSDVVVDCFADADNLEEPTSLSRLISMLNPKLSSRKGKDEYYLFRDLFRDIYVALLSEFTRSHLGVENLRKDVTPESIRKETNQTVKDAMFTSLFRTIIKTCHAEFEDCMDDVADVKPLPEFYPHNKFLRRKYQKDIRGGEATEEAKELFVSFVSDQDVLKIKDIPKLAKVMKPDKKNDYICSLISFLGQYLFLIDCQKNGNALNTYLIQKKLTKIIHATGHKNYSSTLINFKQVILGHWSPQYSHRYLWNVSAGRAGKGMKMPRDQRVEHLNRFLKDSFKSVGVNLDEANASRINNSSDLSMKIETKIVDFHELDDIGKSHTKRDRRKQIDAVSSLFKKEMVAQVVPGRTFKGPNVSKNLYAQFDEAQYRVWHFKKDKEMNKFSEYCRAFRN